MPWSYITSTSRARQRAPVAARRTGHALRVLRSTSAMRKTRLAPPELKAIHPLGKSPVITDNGFAVHETGAIIDYVIRRHGGGRLQPDPASQDYDMYQQWLHYAEGSAMLPHMLAMYVGRLGEAGAPLQPRIESEIANHDGYAEAHLKGREFFVGKSLTGRPTSI